MNIILSRIIFSSVLSCYCHLNDAAQRPHRLKRSPRRIGFLSLSNVLRRTLIAGAAVALAGHPAAGQEDREWRSIGPAGVTSGGVTNIEDGEVVGAINTLAAHPDDADELFIGAVNGGVWRTQNATAIDDGGNVTWENVSSGFPTLAIGALAYDLDDASNLFVGFGRYSSFNRRGLPTLPGVYMSSNDGDDGTWVDIDGAAVDGRSVNALVARGNLVLASTLNRAGGFAEGLFLGQRSGGAWTWTRLSGLATPDPTDPPGTRILPAGRTYDVAADPSTPNLYYTLNDSGVFSATLVETDPVNGANLENVQWTKVSDATVDGAMAGVDHARLDVGPNGEVFVAISDGNELTEFFQLPAGGGAWQALPAPITPAGFPAFFLALTADPSDGNIAYVGASGSNSSFRVDATLPQGDALSGAVAGTAGSAGNTSPHADVRDMAIDDDGNLLEANDGGVYKRISPLDNTGDWVSLNGDLVITEIHNTGWDRVSHVALAGVQDNGTVMQDDFVRDRWTRIGRNDGGDIAIEEVAIPDGAPRPDNPNSNRYYSSQRLGSFRHATYDQDNDVVPPVNNPALTETACPAATGCRAIFGRGNAPFTAPFAANTLAPGRIVFGSNFLSESVDFGQTVQELTADGSGTTTAGDPIAINAGGARDPIASGAGGNVEALYVGQGRFVWSRTAPGQGSVMTRTDPGGGQILDLVIDPNDDQTVFALDANADVHWTQNGGANWTEITGNLGAATTAAPLSIAYSTSNIAGAVIVGMDIGVFIARGDRSSVNDAGGDPIPFTDWEALGDGLPNTPIFDLDYDAVDEILLAGTLGRGAWALNMEERNPIDVILVMDKSGSMGDPACPGCESKLTALQDAAEVFVQTWQVLSDADDRIGAVFFDSGVEAFQRTSDGLELPTLVGSGDDVIDYIRDKTDGGATAMGGGLQRAIGIFDDPERARSIVLFTDGMQNRDPMAVEDGDSFIIDNTGRTGSGVAPLPDPTRLDAGLDIRVNAIGFALTEPFQQDLTDIANDTGGLFKAAPDTASNPDIDTDEEISVDLRRFFIENLVDALRDASPQIVDYRYPTIGASRRDDQEFRVNVGAKTVAFAVSWDRRDATSANVRVFKDGVEITALAEETRSGDFYRVLSFDTTAASPLSSDGVWRVETQTGAQLRYEIVALADDGFLDYRFAAHPVLARAGDPTRLSATVSVDGLPHGDDVNVTARVAIPRESLATVLATTPTPPEVVTAPREPGETLAQAKLAYLLLNDSAFRRRLRPTYTTATLERRSAGRFESAFSETTVAGAYRVNYLLEGDGPITGAFERSERGFFVVAPGPFSEGGSRIETEIVGVVGGRTVTRVRVRPVDDHGNYLGPDAGDEISGVAVGEGVTGTVSDDGNGWYVIEFETVDADPVLDITIDGDRVASGPASTIATTRPSRSGSKFYLSAFGGVAGSNDDAVGLPAFVGAPIGGAVIQSERGWTLGGAIGVTVGSVGSVDVRLEGEIARRSADTKPRTGLYSTGERRMWTFMANAAADADVTPGLTAYAGGGIGLARANASQPVFDNSTAGPPFLVTFEDQTTNFAWQAFLGLAQQIHPRVDWFVQGRYLDAGDGDLTNAGDSIVSVDFKGWSGETGFRVHF